MLAAAPDSPHSSAAAVDATVTVQVVGTGTVRGPGGLACQSSCPVTAAIESDLALQAEPAAGNHFVGWDGPCTGTAMQCDAVVEEAGTVTATFAPGGTRATPATDVLRVTTGGEGNVVSEPEGTIECGTRCSAAVSHGSSLQLVAVADPGWAFDGWTGACSGPTPSCTVAVATDVEVGAMFRAQSVPSGTRTLTISTVSDTTPPPNSGIAPFDRVDFFFTDSEGHRQSGFCVGTCHLDMPAGTVVTLTAAPRPGATVEWGGRCVGAAVTCTLPMSGNSGVVALFAARPSPVADGLNVTRVGVGRVTSAPAGIDCGGRDGCRAAFDRNSRVRLSAERTNANFAFGGWRNDCSSDPCVVPMGAERSVIAVFRRIRDVVKVDVGGTGGGSVTSDPAGIACTGGAGCQARFARGSRVTLSATDARLSRFVRWSGDCTTSARGCALNLTGPASATAHFQLCASRAVNSFTASSSRRPRRVAARFTLAAPASVRVRILRSRAIATTQSGRRAAGRHSVAVDVPRRVRAGRYTVELRLVDTCGETKRLTRPVRIPANG